MDDGDIDDAELWALIDNASAAAASRRRLPTPSFRPPQPLKCPRLTADSNAVASRRQLLPPPSPTLQQQGTHYYQPPPNPIPPAAEKRSSFYFQSPSADLRVSASPIVERKMPASPISERKGFTSPVVERKVLASPVVEGKVLACPIMERKGFVSSVVESPPPEGPSETRKHELVGRHGHSLMGQFPSVTTFKEFQNMAMEILEKSDYTNISGNPYIKKSGWRKIAFFFNISFEIKDRSIEFDENRNVVRAEFLVRAHMQGGRFSDGWGSCDRQEKRFNKPNHDIPSTAETRAKTKACQDLVGIGQYRSR